MQAKPARFSGPGGFSPRNLAFSVLAYGIMVVALPLLPKTRGRTLTSLEQPAAE